MFNNTQLRFLTIVIALVTFALIPFAIFEKGDYSYLLAVGLAAYALYTNLKYNN